MHGRGRDLRYGTVARLGFAAMRERIPAATSAAGHERRHHAVDGRASSLADSTLMQAVPRAVNSKGHTVATFMRRGYGVRYGSSAQPGGRISPGRPGPRR
jgi:hypothetical protein